MILSLLSSVAALVAVVNAQGAAWSQCGMLLVL